MEVWKIKIEEESKLRDESLGVSTECRPGLPTRSPDPVSRKAAMRK
jgi:hypothetical protein